MNGLHLEPPEDTDQMVKRESKWSGRAQVSGYYRYSTALLHCYSSFLSSSFPSPPSWLARFHSHTASRSRVLLPLCHDGEH